MTGLYEYRVEFDNDHCPECGCRKALYCHECDHRWEHRDTEIVEVETNSAAAGEESVRDDYPGEGITITYVGRVA